MCRVSLNSYLISDSVHSSTVLCVLIFSSHSWKEHTSYFWYWIFPVKKWKHEIIEEFFTHTTTVIPMINMSYDQELFYPISLLKSTTLISSIFLFIGERKHLGVEFLPLSSFGIFLNNLKFSLHAKPRIKCPVLSKTEFSPFLCLSVVCNLVFSFCFVDGAL